MSREAQIEQALQCLLPITLIIRDDSHKHAGHAGASDGRGHFALYIVSSHFEGLPAIKRHRLVYDALAELLQTDIHALSIQAKTPTEVLPAQV